MPTRVVVAIALASLALAALVLLPGLGTPPPWDPDEGRHAEIARELAVATPPGGWLLPTLDGTPYRRKPVLYYWLAAAALTTGGVEIGMARLPSTLAAIAIVAITGACGAAWWGPLAGMSAATVLTTAAGFALVARLASPDMTFALWITFGVVALRAGLRALPRRTALVPAALAAGLGTLTKGFAAPLVIALVAVVEAALTRRLALLHARPLLVAGGAVLASTLPWMVAVAVLDPPYLPQLVLREHVQRFFAPTTSLHPRSALLYLPVLLVGFLPWSLLLPAALRAARPLGADAPARFCAAWATIVVALFSLSSGKQAIYVLPALPPLALLVGRALAGWLSDARGLPPLAQLGLGLAALGCIVAPPIALVAATWTYDGRLAPAAWLAWGAIPAGILVLWLLTRRRDAAALAALALAMAAGLHVFHTVALPRLADVVSMAPLAAAARAHVPPDANVPIVAYEIRAASLSFALERPVRHLHRPRQIARLRVRHPLVLVATTRRHRDVLDRAGPWYVWWEGPRRLLLGSVPRPTAAPGTP
ncbi:MAG: glycosyltransferase family 39 protein [bacterium]|nr:glycosyltransferase family 39 protein [bacterium]